MKLKLHSDGIRRIKLISSLILSYIFSVFLTHFFFINTGPELNPNAFTQLGSEMQELQTGIQVFMQRQQVTQPTSSPNSGDIVQPSVTGIYSPPSPPVLQPSLPPQQQFPTTIPTQPMSSSSKPSVPVTPTSIPKSPTPTHPLQPTQPKTNVSYADFGKCLNGNGMVMYMTSTCGLCSQQKKTLKDAYNYIRAVDCNANQANGLECSQVGVRGLPTWAKDGKAVYSGPQTLETLGETAGCQVPTN